MWIGDGKGCGKWKSMWYWIWKGMWEGMIVFYGMGVVIMRFYDIFIVFFILKILLFIVLLFFEGWDSIVLNFCLVLVFFESFFIIFIDL